jgi:hypothetical protein
MNKKSNSGVVVNDQWFPTEADTNQTRKSDMILKSSDFDHFDEINPFTQMEHNPEALHRCVNKVKGKKGVNNAYAVCNASLNRKGE